MTTKLTARALVGDRSRRGTLPSVRRTVILRELTPDNAPVAVQARLENVVEDIRWSGGTFYRAFTVSGKPVTPGSPEMKQLDLYAGVFDTEETAISGIEDFLANHVIINGALWIKSSEPLVFVSDNGMYAEVVSSNGRMRHQEWNPWQTYSLNEADDALAAAAALRNLRYGALSKVSTVQELGLEILMPQTITMPGRAERMKAGREAARADAEQAVQELLADFTAEQMKHASRRLASAAEIITLSTESTR